MNISLATASLLTLMGGLLWVTPSVQAEQEGRLMAAKTTSFYDFTMDDIDGKPVSLSQYKGKALLVVNTASFCGNTPQYTDLEAMYEQYRDKGFEILAFPANNFGQQEPGTNAEIKGFCLTKYSVSFPLFSKISVKGSDKHPLYQYLTEKSPFPGEVEWNFQKYLVDRNGNIVARFPHRMKPSSPEIVKEVERVLAAK
ncbi:MAG: Hydroperoxy fatty acid reductase gpx1 [Nitrospira sp.]|nr:MAG: Hydroperoxy fatty acid reductase gpx1 [Nitrospira sp.]